MFPCHMQPPPSFTCASLDIKYYHTPRIPLLRSVVIDQPLGVLLLNKIPENTLHRSISM